MGTASYLLTLPSTSSDLLTCLDKSARGHSGVAALYHATGGISTLTARNSGKHRSIICKIRLTYYSAN